MGFNRVIVASGIGLAVSALVGCGSSGGGLLSRSQADELQAQLDRASGALAAGRCQEAKTTAQQLANSVQNLNGVDSTLVSNLVQGANRIEQLTARDCHPPAPPPTTTQPAVPRTETTTSTPTTPTTQTHTATSTTQSITPPPSTSTTGGSGLNTTTSPVTPTTPATTPAATPPQQTSASGGAGLQGPGAGNTGGQGNTGTGGQGSAGGTNQQ